MVERTHRLIALLLLVALAGCEARQDEPGAGVSEPTPAGGQGIEATDISITLEPAELDWIGQKIFLNECAGDIQCLVHWNKGEAFPSLGIGHFIWYPEGVEARFVESFPALVEYLSQRQVTIPGWLRRQTPFDAPWPDRQAFQAAQDTPEMAELRAFLAGTQGAQAEFIFRRAKAALTRVVDAVPAGDKAVIRERLAALSSTPGGVYALLDYVNFKGEGLAPTERYQGQGWGLLQVLSAMSGASGQTALAQFRAAAAQVLTRRAANADTPIERARWLPGWLKRVDTYREPQQMFSSRETP